MNWLRSIAAFAFLVSAGIAREGALNFKFQFGADRAASDYIPVPASAAYTKESGFGFEPGPALSVVTAIHDPANPLHRGSIGATEPFLFSVRVPEGNYRVTVTLGNPQSATVTTVKAETRRLMVERVTTTAGEFVERTFTVNIRRPTLSGGGEVDLDSREMNLVTREPIARHWDEKLTLGFSGVRPSVAALEIQQVDTALTFFLTGDSTVTDQPNWPGASWGQMITRWFKPGVAIANHAESGETLKGFLKERRWEKVLDALKPGDYVLIEFGTNDSKSSGPQNIYPGQDFAETYAPAETIYKELLRRFVGDVRKKDAYPILASPSARRDETTMPTSLGAWARAAMEVAKELGVPGIDLNAMGAQLNRALGADGPRQFGDRTHHLEYGAYLQAKCIVLGIQRAKLPLASFIADDFRFDPEHPSPLPAEFDLPPDPGSNRGVRAIKGSGKKAVDR